MFVRVLQCGFMGLHRPCLNPKTGSLLLVEVLVGSEMTFTQSLPLPIVSCSWVVLQLPSSLHDSG